MGNFIRISLLSIVLLFPVGCEAVGIHPGPDGPSPIMDKEGKSYYTQVGMWVDGDHLETTNYAAGWFIPVNTKVKIRGTSEDTIDVFVPSREESFRIYNKSSYTEQTIKGIFDDYFGNGKVSLDKFDQKTREYIKNGQVKPGMSKDAVVLARGYPPSHKTPSLEENTWTYWSSRFDRVKVYFKDDRVSRVKD